MSKFTPRPWRFNQNSLGSPTNRHNPIVNAPTGNISRLFSKTALGGCVSNAPELEEAEANARLISAAPDLLAACQEALMSGVPPETFARLKSAIAKAIDETGD